MELAKKLFNEEHIEISQSSIRTMISRGYYAAFLTIREYLIAQGVIFTGYPATHIEVINELKGNRQRYQAIPSKLFSLKKIRERADYDLDKSYTLSDAKEVITLSNLLIEQIEEMS